MKATIKQRAITLLVLVILAVIFLLPTVFRDAFAGTSWISKPIKLGLDLLGGVHLVYQVEGEEAVKTRLQAIISGLKADLRKEKIAPRSARVNDKNEIELILLSDRAIERIKQVVSENYKNLSFVGQTQEGESPKLTFGVPANEIIQISRAAVTQAIETLRNRVDQFGVSEPLIQKSGDDRIILQMPGVSDVQSVKNIVGKVAKLEFRFLPHGGTGGGTITLKNKDTKQPVEVEDEVQMTGEAVDDAQVAVYNNQVEVSLRLTTEGAKTFRDITAANVGRNLGIILDGEVYSSPTIREAISGGQASISGGFSMQEARELAVVLRAGALPAPLKVLEERTVGPTLGAESIHKGMIAMIAGCGVIFAFMLLYYRKSGVVAIIALALNVLFIMALLSAFGATLTLPGLAGLALTVGMAVDASVIVYERIRDEVRNGSTRDAAVEAGYGKAWAAILDANLTTLITGFVLYYFGTGPIRGFAVTLCIGIITTLYTAVSVGRLLFDYFPLQTNKGELSV